MSQGSSEAQDMGRKASPEYSCQTPCGDQWPSGTDECTPLFILMTVSRAGSYNQHHCRSNPDLPYLKADLTCRLAFLAHSHRHFQSSSLTSERLTVGKPRSMSNRWFGEVFSGASAFEKRVTSELPTKRKLPHAWT